MKMQNTWFIIRYARHECTGAKCEMPRYSAGAIQDVASLWTRWSRYQWRRHDWERAKIRKKFRLPDLEEKAFVTLFNFRLPDLEYLPQTRNTLKASQLHKNNVVHIEENAFMTFLRQLEKNAHDALS